MGSKLSMSMQMQTHYLYGYNPVKTSAWDVMQSNVGISTTTHSLIVLLCILLQLYQIKCCGGNTYNEYYHSTWYNISRKVLFDYIHYYVYYMYLIVYSKI